MIFSRRRNVSIETDRMTLRLPKSSDYANWVELRRESQAFLQPWEPAWSRDHLSRKAFSTRVYSASRAVETGTGVPLFLIERNSRALVGAVTLDNIQRGPSETATIGYWVGQRFSRQATWSSNSRLG